MSLIPPFGFGLNARRRDMTDKTCTQVGDPIEEMMKAGWVVDHSLDLSDLTPNQEYLVFTKPRPKPNAIVDWSVIDSVPNPFAYELKERGVAETLAKVLRAIKRA